MENFRRSLSVLIVEFVVLCHLWGSVRRRFTQRKAWSLNHVLCFNETVHKKNGEEKRRRESFAPPYKILLRGPCFWARRLQQQAHVGESFVIKLSSYLLLKMYVHFLRIQSASAFLNKTISDSKGLGWLTLALANVWEAKRRQDPMLVISNAHVTGFCNQFFTVSWADMDIFSFLSLPGGNSASQFRFVAHTQSYMMPICKTFI